MEAENMNVVDQQAEELVEAEHCHKCFKRKVVGASDVYNVYSKLKKASNMQKSFIAKHSEAEKIPRTMGTRVELDAWIDEKIAEFKKKFEDRMIPSCDEVHGLVSKKRKRVKRSEE
jgi:hypothetical protein